MTFTRQFIKPEVKLFDNQVRNVKGLIQRRRALLTDKVGAGKTLSILFAYAYLKEYRKVSNLLVLTPRSAYDKLVWKKDIQKFTTLKAIDLEELIKIVGDSEDRLQRMLYEYQVIYAKHSHVRNSMAMLEKLSNVPGLLLCIDEVHAFRNPKSSLTLLVRQIAANVKNFWGISGSSLSKSLEDVYNVINLIYPWYLGSFYQFREYYCTTRERIIGTVNGRRQKVVEITGVKDEKEFQERIAPIVITGESHVKLKYHYIDYQPSAEDINLYTKIANGIDLVSDMDSADWFKFLMEDKEEHVPSIKSVEKHSSRFIYLQSAADGILSEDGTYSRQGSVKTTLLVNKIREIVAKGQSVIVYFDYYNALYIVREMLKKENLRCKILESTGEHTLKDNDVTEGACKQIPHVILGTRASSESVSYYFINNVIFFHIPTVPHVMIQLNGRITRKNTLYPDDLNCYIFRSENIDLYKLMVVSAKCYQLEIAQGEESNIPPDYKRAMTKADSLDRMKKVLLWQK